MKLDVSRRTLFGAIGASALTLSVGLEAGSSASAAASDTPPGLRSKASTLAQFKGQKARYWGMYGPSVLSRFSTSTATGKGAIALTFDACGGGVTRYDSTLIETLRHYQIPATLFINRNWATHNASTFQSLLRDPLFEIANHGVVHQPLSITGRSQFGIKGTHDLGAVWDEVTGAYAYYAQHYNYRPRFMRPGTCYSDDVASRAAAWIGQPLVSFSVNGDVGATLPAAKVYSSVMTARPGDIVISHMNHPGGGTAPGYEKALPALKAKGLRFRHLSQVL